ncbi:MAG: MmcQ/YjbR family DNA-binding protein [Clostridia bacterium]|nr:MmcQ/YjbR family DNA-binding protein [Clostridia bacterium]
MTRDELTQYIFDAYSVEPDYPFPKDDVTCVFRHAGNRKWFGIVMRIPYRTIGISRDGEADVLNVKCDPLIIGSLRGKPGFRPAYHMNKDKWITVLLDGSAEQEDVTALLDMSYRMTERKMKQAGRMILLNGPSSAGKSSIADKLKQRLQESGADPVIISIDDYMKLEPGEEIWEDDVFEIVPDMCRDITAALRKGRWVIVDHVITSARIYDAHINAAEGFMTVKVLVTCSPEILRKREQARGDRFIGSAETSLQYLYPKEGYDLRIDSGETGAAESAEMIMEYLRRENII